ncbi:MAG TPA: hypothetical protein ENI69_01090 [Rhodospirillales bacterium]|nr:hypothetical protein [Rhodospirillales bacterium]
MNRTVPMMIVALILFGASAEAQTGPERVNRADAASGARVIDIRTEDECTSASMTDARCLPMRNFKDSSGQVIGFHALRWLLGTVGLSGREQVLVIAANSTDALFVGTLLHLAGQRRVSVLDQPFEAPPGAPAGQTRSLSREVVFTSPMRPES